MATRRIQRAAKSLFSPQCRVQSQCTQFLGSQIRSLYNVPPLSDDPQVEERYLRDGIVRHIKGQEPVRLYSGQGFRIAWTQYQAHLVKNLNYLTANEPGTQAKDPLALAKEYGRDITKVNLFNYASQAHNNHFFIKAVSDNPTPLERFPLLHGHLKTAFGSIEALRDLIRNTADGIFGSGNVWLVWARGRDRKTGWRVLATYNGGTPYVLRKDGSADRTQGKDMNNVSASTTMMTATTRSVRDTDQARPLGAPEEIVPVLCLSVWEHSYLRDYLSSGKREFVDAWWECIDWEVVNQAAPPVSREGTFGHYK